MFSYQVVLASYPQGKTVKVGDSQSKYNGDPCWGGWLDDWKEEFLAAGCICFVSLPFNFMKIQTLSFKASLQINQI